jgi:hypothetical protein
MLFQPSTIYLNAQVVSRLGEDTSWTWFKREIPSSPFVTLGLLRNEDVILMYSSSEDYGGTVESSTSIVLRISTGNSSHKNYSWSKDATLR